MGLVEGANTLVKATEGKPGKLGLQAVTSVATRAGLLTPEGAKRLAKGSKVLGALGVGLDAHSVYSAATRESDGLNANDISSSLTSAAVSATGFFVPGVGWVAFGGAVTKDGLEIAFDIYGESIKSESDHRVADAYSDNMKRAMDELDKLQEKINKYCCEKRK